MNENKTEQHSETGASDTRKASNKNPLEQLFYLALGGALAAKERMERDSARFKDFQHQAEDSAREFLDDLNARGEDERESVRNYMRGLLREVIDDLGLATKEDLEQLKKDLER